MKAALYVGISRQAALRRQLDVVANNIANAETAGFKGERMVFEELVHLARPKGALAEAATSFAVDRATYTDERPGGLTATGNPLDVAIQGDGWFSYQTPAGTLYGRDGRFSLDPQGRLVSIDGNPVLDQGGAPIVVLDGAGQLAITPDGTVADGDRVFGRIGLVRFDGAQRLQRVGGGLFAAPADQTPRPADDARLAQGMVERSNVQPIVEVSRMLELHRAYDTAAKLADGVGDLEKTAVSRLGSPSR